MKRAGMTMPLPIGGATTSKVHTALRIDPAYDGPVLHVLDASRAVGVATSLISTTGRADSARRTLFDLDSGVQAAAAAMGQGDQIGRASCRDRVCPYV